LLLCRTDDGISLSTNHKELFTNAKQLSNVVALDDRMPHTLPPGAAFFRVNESLVGKKNIRTDKYVLNIQVFNADGLATTSARLSEDKKMVIITMADPDKFGHARRTDIAHQLANAIKPEHEEFEDQVYRNYVTNMTKASTKAVEHYTYKGLDLAMKKVYCLLPPGIVGSNAYFNDGDGESAFLLFAPFLTTTCSPPFI